MRRVAACIAVVILAACEQSGPPATAPASTIATTDVQSLMLPGSGTWTQLADLPAYRKYGVGAAIGGVFYVVGGQDTAGVPQSSLYGYHPGDNSWHTLASMPAGRWQHAVAVLGGKLWVIGGDAGSYSGATTTWIYDPVGNSWSNGPDFAFAEYGATATVCNNRLYVVGGWPWYNQVWMLNYNHTTWLQRRKDPVKRWWAQTGCVGSDIYVTGGSYGGSDANDQALDIYDTEANTWSSGTPDPAFVAGGTWVNVAGMLYPTTATHFTGMTGYDPDHDRWTQLAALPGSVALNSAAGAVINGSIFLSAGYDNNNTASQKSWKFKPAFAGNHAPVGALAGGITAAEESFAYFDATGSTDPDGDSFTYAWDFGDGGTSTDVLTTAHRYATYGTYHATLTLDDGNGGVTVVARNVQVTDVAPDVSALTPRTLFDGELYEYPSGFSDPGTGDTFTGTVDYGDGGGAHALSITGQAYSLSHQYAAPCVVTVTVTIDDGAKQRARSTTVTVLSATAALNFVIAQINAMALPDSVKDSLKAPLQQAKTRIAANNWDGAYAQMTNFQNAIFATQGQQSNVDHAQLLNYLTRLSNVISGESPT